MKCSHFHLDSPCESVSGNKWVVSDLSDEEIKQRGESIHVDLCYVHLDGRYR